MQIFDFSENQIVPKSKFQILAESNSVFASKFVTNFVIFRVYIQNFPSHLTKYPKYFPNFSSTNSIQNRVRRAHTVLDRISRHLTMVARVA